jgi:transposase-like protein
MARKRYTVEEIIGQLRTIEIELGKGLAVVDACRKLGITEQTYYRWKKEYVNRNRGWESFISPRGLHKSILTPDPLGSNSQG